MEKLNITHFATQYQCALLIQLFPDEQWPHLMWQAAFDNNFHSALRQRQRERQDERANRRRSRES